VTWQTEMCSRVARRLSKSGVDAWFLHLDSLDCSGSRPLPTALHFKAARVFA